MKSIAAVTPIFFFCSGLRYTECWANGKRVCGGKGILRISISLYDDGPKLQRFDRYIPQMFETSFTQCSAGGILPASFEDVNASTWFSAGTTYPDTLAGMTVIPATVKTASPLLSGLSTNYSMVQQGDCSPKSVAQNGEVDGEQDSRRMYRADSRTRRTSQRLTSESRTTSQIGHG